MNIVDALIQKGSTGGNNIAEAIENLPAGGSGSGGGGGVFWIKPADLFNSFTTGESTPITSDVTFDEIVEAYNAGMDIKVLACLTTFPGGKSHAVLNLDSVQTDEYGEEPTTFYLKGYTFSGPYSNSLQMTTYQVGIGENFATGMKTIVNITASSST